MVTGKTRGERVLPAGLISVEYACLEVPDCIIGCSISCVDSIVRVI